MKNGAHPSFIVQKAGGSGWETNPPRLATRPAAGVEDQEAHRDLTTPALRIIERRRICKERGFGDFSAVCGKV